MTVKLVNKNYQTVLIVAIILFIGFVVYNAFTGETSKYTPEELQSFEFWGFDTNMLIVFIAIMVFVIFLSTPYGRAISEMAMYD